MVIFLNSPINRGRISVVTSVCAPIDTFHWCYVVSVSMETKEASFRSYTCIGILIKNRCVVEQKARIVFLSLS